MMHGYKLSLSIALLSCVLGCSSSSTTGESSTSTTGDTSASTTGGDTDEHFSFFVTSLKAMQEQSGSADGFGGDLRFGETGPGAGLRGADKLCATIAEKSMPGAGKKQWRAFLSAKAGEDGKQVDAIDRIGDGPWYDRLGRIVAKNKEDLLHDRSEGADAAIKDDLPNEDGVPNNQPDPTQPKVDNHDILTGSNDQGRLYSPSATCQDWTSALGDLASEGKPRIGHSWPAHFPGGGSTGSGGFGGGFGGGGFGGSDGGVAEEWDPPNWMSSHDAAGCLPGVHLVMKGPPPNGSTDVGAAGGYGGIYCFSLTP